MPSRYADETQRSKTSRDEGTSRSKRGVTTADPARPLSNLRHERFAELVAAGRSVTRAYIEVYGATEKGAAAHGSRLVGNGKVRARIAHLSQTIAKEVLSTAVVDQERVFAEYARLGFANFQDFMTIGDDGLPRLEWRNLTREHAAALAEVTVDMISQGPTRKGEDPLPPVVRVKFKLHPKLPALEGMGRHLKMFTEKVEIEEKATHREHSPGARMVMEMLEMKARGRLPENLRPILDEMIGRGTKQIELKGTEAQR